MGEDDHRVGGRAGAADDVHGLVGRLGQSHVLLVFPDVLEAGRGNAEPLVQLALEEIEPIGIAAEYVHQQHLGLDAPAAVGVADAPRAVNDPHVVGFLDRPELLSPRRGLNGVQRAVDDVAPLAQAAVHRKVRAEQRPKQDRPGDVLGISVRGHQTRNDRPDPPDLLHGLMRHMYYDHP